MQFRHVRNVRGFFSDYYLGSVFGRGEGRGRRRRLSDRDSDTAYRRFVRIRERAEGRAGDLPGCRERFVRPLLGNVLGLHLGAGDDRIHRVFPEAATEASGAPPLLLVWCGAWADSLDGPAASAPTRRLEAALAAARLPYGLLVTGERLRLVRAQGEGPRGAYLEVDLDGLADDQDPESFAALVRLLAGTNFAPDASGVRPLERIEQESRRHAEQVSDDLKRAVFASAETVAGGLLDDARARGALPDGQPDEATVLAFRDAALTALYRMLFILYAEDRDPRLDGHPVYRDTYSMRGALELVLRDPLRPWPANRGSLWMRLTALFRIYDEGLPAISPWENLPPRGGDFFNARTPEGRILDAARLPDSIVARLLVDLATTAARRGVGRERVSFRELDIENLGHVYEGLLEFEPRVEPATAIELRVQGRVFSLAPEEVVRLCHDRGLRLTGDVALVTDTAAEALHPDAAGDGAVEDGPEEELHETDDDEPEEEDEGVSRGATARLVRRIEPGVFHFVPGSSRKGSGSFYTPLELVQDLARHALGPLTERKRPEEIERLRVLDPACGSAHFLVEAMRFLGQALHRAYVEACGGKPPPHFRPTKELGWDDRWQVSDADARASNSEARAWCKRRIAERCLFGVDLNPTAVALARVALWIESLAGDRPLTFFEHHVRCGNSLLGTWLDALPRPPVPSLGEGPPLTQTDVWIDEVRRRIAEAARLRQMIDEASPHALLAEGVEPESVAELEFKADLARRSEAVLEEAKLLFDLRSACVFLPELWNDFYSAQTAFTQGALEAWARERPWWAAFQAVRARERFFHWELEYPEVLLDEARAGFDAVLGNPPWDKVLPSKKEFYAQRDMLVRALGGEQLDRRLAELHRQHPEIKGQFDRYRARTKAAAQYLRSGGDFPLSQARSGAAHEDVSKYFVDRAARLAREGGAAGLVVPSVLYNGDGCVGLRRFLLEEARIERFYGFENRDKVFPIDSRYKFVSLVFRKGGSSERFTAAFMRHHLDELAGDGAKPWLVTVTRDEIERLSPETRAFLEYRDPRDQEIVRRMHAGRLTLGGGGQGAWGVELVSWRDHSCVFNATEDRDLFTDPRSGTLYSPAIILGREPKDPAETMERMRDRGFWPVFEGKHVDQWLVGRKPIRWWLSVERAEQKYGRPPRAEATLVFRETASNTNERTCIAAVLPPRSAGSHTLTGVLLGHADPERAATVLNSICFDFALRLRTAGTNVSFTYILPVAVPPADTVNRLPKIPTRLALDDARAHATDDRALWPLLWEANRAVAEAYGLSAADFEHVLDSFPVLARKRPDFTAFIRERLAEWQTARRPGGDEYPAAPALAPLAAGADRPRRRGR
jgi:hypothetical protein